MTQDAKADTRAKGFGPWQVVSVIQSYKGTERRLMRKALTKRGAEGWAKFYADFLYRGAGESLSVAPMLIRHEYVVERRRD